MRVLLTGFEAYGNYSENSSWVVAEKVATLGVSGVELVVEQMPVSFARAGEVLRRAVDKHSPDAILMLGQSAGSDRVKLEGVALNMMNARSADNDGRRPQAEQIVPHSPEVLMTTVPIHNIHRAVEERGIAVQISDSCGQYVCNSLYYKALLMCHTKPEMSVLFVHLPLYRGQLSVNENKPTMPLEEMVGAIQTIITKIDENRREI